LAALLDPEAFLETLRADLPDIPFQTAKVFYLRYKPGMSCLAGYRLDVRGETVDVHAHALRPDAGDKLVKTVQKSETPGVLGKGQFLFEQSTIVVRVFPNDARVRSLSRLASTEGRRQLLQKHLRDRSDLWSGSLQTLRYRPERRYVARLCGSGAACAVARAYAEPIDQATHPSARVWRSSGNLRLPRPLGCSSRRRVLVLEWLTGDLLREWMTTPQFSASSVAAVGAALAELHGRSSIGLRRRVPVESVRALAELAAWLGFLCPELAARAQTLARTLADAMDSDGQAAVTTHGDFHAGQVLLDGDSVGLLDLDEAVCADRAADLGNFLAHLEGDFVRGRLVRARMESIHGALLEGYRASATHTVDTRIAWHYAAGLFRLCAFPFRERLVDWPDLVDTLLLRAEALAQAVSSSTVHLAALRGTTDGQAVVAGGILSRDDDFAVSVSDRFDAAGDPAMPFLQQALNPVAVHNHFARHGVYTRLGADHARLSAIRVTRYKPGRRCLIDYDLSLHPEKNAPKFTLIGKARARSSDRSTYQLVCRLWQGGFAEDASDGVSVPEPIGLIPELHMWLQRKVPGTSATNGLATPDGPALARRIADTIHKLHRAGIPAKRRHGMAEELTILEERLGRVARARPEWARRLDNVLAACRSLGQSLPPHVPRGIHRDFYPAHVLVDGTRLYLLDFDLYAAGDPGLDIGNFLGHLIEHSLRTCRQEHAWAEQEAALRERFIELAGESARASISVYETLTLVRHVYLRTQFPERTTFTEALLELCEQRLDIGVLT
jgi:aminoglycoside phosphotransferase (APT) family kinase protein